MNCYYAGDTEPRMISGRHLVEGCECRGCLPCPWSHCRICTVTHAEHACPGCMSETREALDDIRRMVATLPAEVEHRGIESEAMNLLGPVADPESIGHMRASANVGRIPEDWIEVADHELHPLLVLGTWQAAYLEAFDHPEPETRVTISGAASYLERNLSYASVFEDVPFEDFARDLRQCRAHMERVLHDGEQVETGAPCMTCRVPLRLIRTDGPEDRWQCPRCREESTDAQYRFAVQHLHREHADWLTASEVEVLCGIRPATLRKRVERGEVKSRRDSGRVVYCAEQIPEVMETRKRSA